MHRYARAGEEGGTSSAAEVTARRIDLVTVVLGAFHLDRSVLPFLTLHIIGILDRKLNQTKAEIIPSR